MTQAKNTPGPWHHRAPFDICREITGVTYPVAQCLTNDFVSVNDALANAHLIAAAPELLEALEQLCDQFRSHFNNYEGLSQQDELALDVAEHAINKAKGIL